MFITPKYSRLVFQQISLVDSFLLKLKDVLVDPVVAGGAPRDWFFNKKATDIDIFVSPCSAEELREVLANRLNVNIDLKTSEELPEQYRSSYIAAVLTFSINRITFQVIVKSDTTNVLLNFPCSLSCITYENFNIKPTNIFLNSIRTGTLYFTTNCNQKYERKLILKFRNYKIAYQDRIIYPEDFIPIDYRSTFNMFEEDTLTAVAEF